VYDFIGSNEKSPCRFFAGLTVRAGPAMEKEIENDDGFDRPTQDSARSFRAALLNRILNAIVACLPLGCSKDPVTSFEIEQAV
jgi:hypothetical protein